MNTAHAVDRRSTDLVTVPRSSVEESWMDVTTLAFEVRRDLGRAYAAQQGRTDPRPHLYRADQRLIRLSEYGRRKSAEAAGITYIDPAQLSLFDGCLPDGDRAG